MRPLKQGRDMPEGELARREMTRLQAAQGFLASADSGVWRHWTARAREAKTISLGSFSPFASSSSSS
jgi:hypothetical protein